MHIRASIMAEGKLAGAVNPQLMTDACHHVFLIQLMVQMYEILLDVS